MKIRKNLADVICEWSLSVLIDLLMSSEFARASKPCTNAICSITVDSVIPCPPSTNSRIDFSTSPAQTDSSSSVCDFASSAGPMPYLKRAMAKVGLRGNLPGEEAILGLLEAKSKADGTVVSHVLPKRYHAVLCVVC